MEKDHGLELPRRLQIEFSKVIQELSDDTGKEIDSDQIWQAFDQEFIQSTKPLEFIEHHTEPETGDDTHRNIEARISFDNESKAIKGSGNGPIDAFVDSLKREFDLDFRVVDYHQHATGAGSSAQSACFVEIQVGKGETRYGVGLHSNIVCASLIAVCSAVNRASKDILTFKSEPLSSET